MVDKARRQELVRQFQELKPIAGIFAVRCGDRVWVGASPNLASAKTALWFQLKNGGYINRDVQSVWTAKGADAFGFDVLEEVSDDNRDMVPLLLKQREAHWRTTLNAKKIAG